MTGFPEDREPVNFNAMKLTTFLTLAIVALISASRAEGQGQDQFVFGVSGGVLVPSGLAADNHKLGPNGGLMLGIGAVDSPFGVRFDGMYGALGSKTGTGAIGLGAARITQVSANILFTLLGQEKKLYFVGGAGAFNYNPDGTGTKATNDLGVNAGLGFWIPGLNGFVEARWFNLYRALPNPTTLDKGKSSLRIYPISFGMMF